MRNPAEVLPAEPAGISIGVYVPPATPTEEAFAATLADVLGVDQVSVESRFFDDLGADSMVMAQFCARVRKRADLPSVSMKDVYQNPSVRSLAAALAAPATAPQPGSVETVETALAEVLADVVGAEKVSVDGHFFDDLGADSMVMAQFCARVRKRADLPSVSMKDVYQNPTIRSLAGAFAAPVESPVEGILAEVLADLLGAEKVSVDGHFFDDLGADSMVMAQFCARVRKRDDVPPVSMKDVYANPTVRSLAAALAENAPAAAAPAAAAPAPTEPAPAPRRASGVEYVVCGILQVLLFVGYTYLTATITVRGYEWIAAGHGMLEYYLRAVVFSTAVFTTLCTLPILLKWILIGRWKRRRIRIWSLGYVRFWFVKTLVQANPLVLFVGTPLYSLYLRLLGAKIGRGVLIFSRHIPVCTDLVTIGAGSVIRKDSFLTSYRARAGVIHTGPITLGRDVLVGEKSVLDVDTAMGDGAQLGHVSSLHAGHAVPAGQSWHGSPAQPADVSYRFAEPRRCGALRRFTYPAAQLFAVVVVYLPLVFFGVDILLASPQVARVIEQAAIDTHTWTFWGELAALSAVLLVGSIVVGILFMYTVPRVLNLAIKPDTTYPLYGFRYSLHRTIARTTNSKFLTNLFGDSSYIVPFLRGLGYRLTPLVQTGSNFGTEVKHDSPYLCSVGTGTVCASELSLINADYSSTSFRLSRAAIPAHSYLGNLVTYPAQGKVGENCLLATKVMVPISGKVREGVGLLGSPSFEIPRTVERDTRFNHLTRGEERRRRLAAKNKHNAATIGMFLFARWIQTLGLLLLGYAWTALYPRIGAAALAGAMISIPVFTFAYSVFVERASLLFRAMPPKYCSIYQRDFWHTERFFKMTVPPWLHLLFAGTPFKSVVWRLVGVRVGKRLFDDGAGMAEKNLVTIGDDVTLNAGVFIQCHSQEDYVFKCDRISIGSGCSIGTGAMMLYSTKMGDGSSLAVDSFLMKGEEIPPGAQWGGNPAREMPDALTTVPQLRRAAAPPVPIQPVSVVATPRRRAVPAAALVAVGVVAGGVVAYTAGPSVQALLRSATLPAGPIAALPVAAGPAEPAPAPVVDPPAPAPGPVVAPPAPAAVPANLEWFGSADLPLLATGLPPGSSGPAVVTVQQHLQRLGYYTGPADGRMEGPTEAAVRRFQEDARITGDPAGTVGRVTAEALVAGGEQPVLRPGDTGDDVHRLQHALALALSRALPASGNYLTQTQDAVRDYQASRGLPVTGTATAETWTALQQGR